MNARARPAAAIALLMCLTACGTAAADPPPTTTTVSSPTQNPDFPDTYWNGAEKGFLTAMNADVAAGLIPPKRRSDARLVVLGYEICNDLRYAHTFEQETDYQVTLADGYVTREQAKRVIVHAASNLCPDLVRDGTVPA